MTTITFFLDGTAMVCDQHGHPIRGARTDTKEVWFAITAPTANRDAPAPYERRFIEINKKKVPLATHAEVVAALKEERIDWKKLTWAGTPQLPYEQLKEVALLLSATSFEELRRIPDAALRKDVLRVHREVNEVRMEEIERAKED